MKITLSLNEVAETLREHTRNSDKNKTKTTTTKSHNTRSRPKPKGMILSDYEIQTSFPNHSLENSAFSFIHHEE